MPPRAYDAWRSWPPSSDAVARARGGDDRVLTDIAAAAIPKLLAFYHGLGMQRHDAEDLASDTCEAIVRTLPRLREVDRFEPWFWRIARSKYYDQIRRIKRPQAPPERETDFGDPSESVVVLDEHAEIRQAFAKLRPRDRELLWMREVIGLGYADIAGRFSLREGAVRIAVMRARQRLEEALGERLTDNV